MRVPDPFVAVKRHWLIRRLAPDCSRIELGSLPKTKDELKLLQAMGRETANIHLGTKAAAGRVLVDLKRRTGKWLRRAAEAMAKVTIEDWKCWFRSNDMLAASHAFGVRLPDFGSGGLITQQKPAPVRGVDAWLRRSGPEINLTSRAFIG